MRVFFGHLPLVSGGCTDGLRYDGAWEKIGRYKMNVSKDGQGRWAGRKVFRSIADAKEAEEGVCDERTEERVVNCLHDGLLCSTRLRNAESTVYSLQNQQSYNSPSPSSGLHCVLSLAGTQRLVTNALFLHPLTLVLLT
jgi:hypothetical protein